MTTNPAGNGQFNATSPDATKKIKDNTSISFDEKTFQQFEKALVDQKVTDKKIRQWHHNRNYAKTNRKVREINNLSYSGSVNEISVQMATYINSALNKRIFQIDIDHLARIEIDDPARTRLEERLVATGIHRSELELDLDIRIGDLLNNKRRKTISSTEAKKINKFLSSTVFDLQSSLKYAENKNNNTNTAAKRPLSTSQGAKGQGESTESQEPVAKKAKIQPSENNITTNAPPYNDILQHRYWYDDWGTFGIANALNATSVNPGFGRKTN